MQEPLPNPSPSRVFLLTFSGAQIYYSTTEDSIVSVLSRQQIETTAQDAGKATDTSERKPAR